MIMLSWFNRRYFVNIYEQYCGIFFPDLFVVSCVLQYYCKKQCCVSVTFGYGSGSADP
jgi:hypothetical protein